jgi:hypothetical protein
VGVIRLIFHVLQDSTEEVYIMHHNETCCVMSRWQIFDEALKYWIEHWTTPDLVMVIGSAC